MNITHAWGGGVYVKSTAFEAGDILVQHKHKFDHLSILAMGAVELIVDGKRDVIYGPRMILIEAGKHHGIKALTGGIWYCINKDADEQDLIEPEDPKVIHELLSAMGD